MLGDEDTAAEIAEYHHGASDWLPDGVEQCGRGEHRTVYVDWEADLVYKVGLDSANRTEHDILSTHAGEDCIPPVDLYEVAVQVVAEDYDIDRGLVLRPTEITCTIVVMPYLPEDGSVEHAGMVHPLAADFNEDNLVANGGMLWLIDAGGM